MIAEFYLINLLAVTTMMVIGWVFSVHRHNVTIVDTLWGLGFVLIAWLTYFQVDGFPGRKLLLAGLTTLWGVRLSIFLTIRNHGKGEDPRYARWRQSSGPRFWLTSLCKVFLLQALFLWIIALVVQAGQSSAAPAHFTVADLLGAIVWAIGFFFEVTGDAQLAKFKSNPDNRSRVMDQGLWRYTRHPNYFGECLIWWGLFIIAISDFHLWWTVASPIVITTVLLKMTGVPLTEKLSLEKRTGYHDYRKTTPAFFPWFPKRPTNELERCHEKIDTVGRPG
jgi:steroid 5-alpha reductase family enzyme